MTPTLFGRWQTRIFLLATVGIFFTLPFAFGYLGNNSSMIYFWILFYVGILGLGWDLLYNFLQKFLWDHDWPGILQFFAAIAEGFLVVFLIQTGTLPFIDKNELRLEWFFIHYSVVSMAAYTFSWVIMRLLFPRWRFRGGVWLGKWPRG